MSFVSCIVMMSVCMLCMSFLEFLNFVSDAIYVDLKYGDGFVLLLIVVCEWVGGWVVDVFVCRSYVDGLLC